MAEKSKKFEIVLNSSNKYLSSVICTLDLPNLFSLRENVVHVKDSPTFEFAKATWSFRFYPKGRPKIRSKKYFDVSIIRKSSKISIHKIFYTITLEHFESFEKDEVYNVDVFDKDNLEHGVACFIEKRCKITDGWGTPLTPERRNLKLTCELICDEMERIPRQEALPVDKGVVILRQDLKELFLNGENHDLTLKATDKEFNVHRNILMARSKVFKAMLSHNMTEKNSGVVDLPDCDAEAMEQFLYYVYTGKVEALSQDNMLELYYIADKYDMDLLKDECTDMIKKTITPSNISDVIQYSLIHGDNGLLKFATDYFMNHTSDILPTVEWMSFMKSNLIAANELLIKASKKWHIVKS